MPVVRRLAILAPLAVFAAFLIAVLTRQPPAPPPSPLVGHPVPAFDLPGYDATHPGLASADLAHGAPTLVNVFASWCLPCRVESPQLAALAAKGIPVHGLAVRDTRANLAMFFRSYGNAYRRIGLDTNGRVQDAWGVQGIPQTLVIDGHGIVRAVHMGDVRADDLPGLKAEIDRARS